MQIINRMLRVECFRTVASLGLVVTLLIGCDERHVSIPVASKEPDRPVRVDVFMRHFDSTAPFRLDDEALMSANDFSFSVTDPLSVDRINREIMDMACTPAHDVADVGDVRLLIQLNDGAGYVHKWHASQFYYQDEADGAICVLDRTDKQRLENMVQSLHARKAHGP